jgi:hypothetical protein
MTWSAFLVAMRNGAQSRAATVRTGASRTVAQRPVQQSKRALSTEAPITPKVVVDEWEFTVLDASNLATHVVSYFCCLRVL